MSIRSLVLAASFFILSSYAHVDAVGPKTVSVKGYTRKDGTFVRPHMRSRPGYGSTIPYIYVPPKSTAYSQERKYEAKSSTSVAAIKPRASEAISSMFNIKNAVVDFRNASITRPRLVNDTISKFASKRLLVIDLAVWLQNDSELVQFLTFAGPRVQLKNAKGQFIRHIEKDEGGLWPSGRNTSLRPLSKGKHADTLIFEIPEDFTDELTLEVYWDYAGDEPIVIVIPCSKIVR